MLLRRELRHSASARQRAAYLYLKPGPPGQQVADLEGELVRTEMLKALGVGLGTPMPPKDRRALGQPDEIRRSTGFEPPRRSA